MDIDDLFKQIQKESVNSKLKIEQCNTYAKRGLKAYRDDLLRKQAEIEKGIDAHIAEVIEISVPRKSKYQEFRNEKIALFNKVRSDTENEVKLLGIKIDEQTEILMKNVDIVLEKMNILAQETQNLYSNFTTIYENEPKVMNIKCNHLYLETSTAYLNLKEQLMKCLKYALEVFQQINKEMHVNTTRRGNKNKKKYDELMKKFHVKFENIKYKNVNN